VPACKGGPGWAEALRLTHDYDDTGRRTISQHHTRSAVDALAVSMRQVYSYNEQGTQIETRFQVQKDGK
jgi:hypothetical protein